MRRVVITGMGVASPLGNHPGELMAGLEAGKHGISKINIGTDIRQPYETVLKETGKIDIAKEAVYKKTKWVLAEYLKISGSRSILEQA